mmetsp:Transcript_20193/g.65215  ORF Transcript_20193/g.65215 Transcript_20193/m.65215 type:complete len:111 (+) Transcript_20193:242-574(+)
MKEEVKPKAQAVKMPTTAAKAKATAKVEFHIPLIGRAQGQTTLEFFVHLNEAETLHISVRAGSARSCWDHSRAQTRVRRRRRQADAAFPPAAVGPASGRSVASSAAADDE